MGAPFVEEIENREIEADGSTLPLRKDAESSFLGVVFGGLSLQTEAWRSARTLAPGARESVPPREGPRVPAQGRGGPGGGRWAAIGQQRAVWRAPRAGCSQPRDGPEIWAAAGVCTNCDLSLKGKDRA